MANDSRVVRISFWYLFGKILYNFSLFIVLFIVLSFVGIAANYQPWWYYMAAMIAGVIGLFSLFGNVLYWKNSGIYITSRGDHIVKVGGYTLKEEKLLNGIVISNQVMRTFVDRIIGTASINVGIMGFNPVAGVVYKDIAKYDDLMRGSGLTKHTTIF